MSVSINSSNLCVPLVSQLMPICQGTQSETSQPAHTLPIQIWELIAEYAEMYALLPKKPITAEVRDLTRLWPFNVTASSVQCWHDESLRKENSLFSSWRGILRNIDLDDDFTGKQTVELITNLAVEKELQTPKTSIENISLRYHESQSINDILTALAQCKQKGFLPNLKGLFVIEHPMALPQPASTGAITALKSSNLFSTLQHLQFPDVTEDILQNCPKLSTLIIDGTDKELIALASTAAAGQLKALNALELQKRKKPFSPQIEVKLIASGLFKQLQHLGFIIPILDNPKVHLQISSVRVYDASDLSSLEVLLRIPMLKSASSNNWKGTCFYFSRYATAVTSHSLPKTLSDIALSEATLTIEELAIRFDNATEFYRFLSKPYASLLTYLELKGGDDDFLKAEMLKNSSITDSLIYRCPRLRILQLTNFKICSISTAESFSRWQSIEELHLHFYLNDEISHLQSFLTLAAGLPNLKRCALHLRDPDQIYMLPQLLSFKTLQEVEIVVNFVSLGDISMADLRERFRQKREVTLEKRYMGSEGVQSFLVHASSAMTNLQVIKFKLYANRIHDFPQLLDLPNLEEVWDYNPQSVIPKKLNKSDVFALFSPRQDEEAQKQAQTLAKAGKELAELTGVTQGMVLSKSKSKETAVAFQKGTQKIQEKVNEVLQLLNNLKN